MFSQINHVDNDISWSSEKQLFVTVCKLCQVLGERGRVQNLHPFSFEIGKFKSNNTLFAYLPSKVNKNVIESA